jgi:hypothetical protein
MMTKWIHEAAQLPTVRVLDRGYLGRSMRERPRENGVRI